MRYAECGVRNEEPILTLLCHFLCIPHSAFYIPHFNWYSHRDSNPDHAPIQRLHVISVPLSPIELWESDFK